MRAGSDAIGAPLPGLIGELLEIGDNEASGPELRVRQLYPGNVEAATIRERLRMRASEMLPGALLVDDYHLPRSGVDLAIFSDRATVGILIAGSDDPFARPRRAPGIEAFDHAIAIVAKPHLDHLDVLHPAVQRFVVHVENGRLIFVPAFAPEGSSTDGGGTSARTPSMILGVLLRREIAPIARCLRGRRADESDGDHLDRCLSASEARRLLRETVARRDVAPGPLIGRVIADALAERLAATTPAPAAVIREMAIAAYNGGVADLALATPAGLHLYEVKGETDSTARLTHQVEAYDVVGSTCTLVTTWGHVTAFSARVPEHWGLLVTERPAGGSCHFRQIRPALPNPHQRADLLTLCLLTRDLHAILRRVRRGRPWRYSGVHHLRELVVQSLDHATLTTVVTRALAMRKSFEQRRTAAVLVGAPQDWPGLDAILRCGVEGPILGSDAAAVSSPS